MIVVDGEGRLVEKEMDSDDDDDEESNEKNQTSGMTWQIWTEQEHAWNQTAVFVKISPK